MRIRLMRVVASCSLVFFGLVSICTLGLAAETPEQFYKGKTMNIVVGAAAGANTDLMTRIIANHLTKEIGVKVRIDNRGTAPEAENKVYNDTAKDGLTLLTCVSNRIVFNDLLKAPGVQYKTGDFSVIAALMAGDNIFCLSPKSNYRTLEQLRAATGLTGGGTSAKGSTSVSMAVAFAAMGLNGKLISGYSASNEVALALARGEITCLILDDSQAARQQKNGNVVPLFTLSNKKSAILPNLPTASEFGIKVASEYQDAWTTVSKMAQIVWAPPKVPQERIDYLRKVLNKIDGNEVFQKELEKVSTIRLPSIPWKEAEDAYEKVPAKKGLGDQLQAMLDKYSQAK